MSLVFKYILEAMPDFWKYAAILLMIYMVAGIGFWLVFEKDHNNDTVNHG